MTFRVVPLAVALVLSPVPAAAQDLAGIFGPGPDNPVTVFKNLFKAEPLTPAEAARLPAARQVADSLMPPGAYGKAIQDALSPMTDRILAIVEPRDAARAAKLAELAPSDLQGFAPTKIEAIIALLDPGAADRNQRMADFVFAEIAAAMVKLEPHYREGLARAYARHFDAAQLAELNAFFATPTGALYAARAMAMNLDPQVMATIPDMVPVIVGHVAEAATRFVLAMDTIPQPRKPAALGTRERAQLLRLLGMSEADYAARVSAAASSGLEWEEGASGEGPTPEQQGGVSGYTFEGGLEEVE